MQEKN